ncbi:kinase-like domain-containing protein [Glomus cerebriforme]|uniref:Kinase-like domain-containing protein n=1 Tax=Glomus cerebriforme TaxID=658196 RepID=A0A397S7K2_9GLOM|nr:kinase-like domain-containing protein [Glomus cerebriforme]
MKTIKKLLSKGDDSDSIAEGKNLWKSPNINFQYHISDKSDVVHNTDRQVIYKDDLKKRKEIYGICGECGEPGTGRNWCQPCNAERFKENFINWTSGNKDIDELIQQSQLNAVYYTKCLEWIPFEKFENVAYATKGGFSKIYSADWPEGYIHYWDIENQKWDRFQDTKVALKSLNNSSEISTEFLNEIKSYISDELSYVIPCFGITQDPNTKDYMIVLFYCQEGNLRNCLNKSVEFHSKIEILNNITSGLLHIHSAGKVHKDFHSGNILFANIYNAFISDLGMCQPANNEKQSIKKGVYGVLPYMAPEILRGNQYTKAADIYSFGIIMNEYLSEEIPYYDIPHDNDLAIKICRGLRPKISDDTPKLIADLINKCWDAKPENRPTSKKLCQILEGWREQILDRKGEIYSQIKDCEKIKETKSENRSIDKDPENIQINPQAIYTSRLLTFEDLPEPVNAIDFY